VNYRSILWRNFLVSELSSESKFSTTRQIRGSSSLIRATRGQCWELFSAADESFGNYRVASFGKANEILDCAPETYALSFKASGVLGGQVLQK